MLSCSDRPSLRADSSTGLSRAPCAGSPRPADLSKHGGRLTAAAASPGGATVWLVGGSRINRRTSPAAAASAGSSRSVIAAGAQRPLRSVAVLSRRAPSASAPLESRSDGRRSCQPARGRRLRCGQSHWLFAPLQAGCVARLGRLRVGAVRPVSRTAGRAQGSSAPLVTAATDVKRWAVPGECWH
jgi:hypothetical protein